MITAFLKGLILPAVFAVCTVTAFAEQPDQSRRIERLIRKWRVANVEILLSHQDQLYVCRVAWMADNLLVIEPLDEKGDGKGCAEYERADAAQDRPRAVEGELDQNQSGR